MKIVLAKYRGFCYGVERAVKMAMECVGSAEKVATLGPIIHNPQMVEHLAAKGIGLVHGLEEMSEGTIIIRSHGAGPEIYQQAKQQGLTIIDATCPHVGKAQTAAREMHERSFAVVVVGEKNHPEVQSIVAWTDCMAVVIDSIVEAEQLTPVSRLGVVAQTTFPPGRFAEITQILKTKAVEVVIDPTICSATELRQQAAVDLAAVADTVIVVGGKNSANTSRLAELCKLAGARVYHIETAAELEKDWFHGVNTAGITAGASTPDWLIEEVYQRMQLIEQEMNQEMGILEPGSIVKGTVVGVRDDEVFVDMGYKSEGVISLAELAYPRPEKAGDVIQNGDIIDVFILNADTTEGAVQLSKVKADQLLAWDILEQALAEKKTVEGKVIGVVKGGLSVAVQNIRGFVPASQLDVKFVEDLNAFADQTLTLLPIEVNREKRQIVLSRRALLEEERRQQETVIYSKLTPKQVIKGTVRRLADFGVFVDIGGVDGLVHISDLAWHRVKNPAEIVSVGDEIEVLVLGVDPVAKKISLSLKAMGRDPWFDIAETLVEGSVVDGKVTKTSKFGAFVEIVPGVEGLVHLSELDDRRVNSAEEVVTAGQLVPVKVLSVDKKTKRISLSIIQAKQDADRADYGQYLEDDRQGLGFTIGDKLGHLFNQ